MIYKFCADGVTGQHFPYVRARWSAYVDCVLGVAEGVDFYQCLHVMVYHAFANFIRDAITFACGWR
jgi:hypothetical protein